MDTEDIYAKGRCGSLMGAKRNKLAFQKGTFLCLMTKCVSWTVYLNDVVILSTKYCFVTAAFATDELK